MPRPSEIQAEEAAPSRSPLRRSCRIVAVSSPAPSELKLVKGRRLSTTSIDSRDEETNAESKPTARTRASSVTKEIPEPAKPRGRRPSVTEAPIKEEENKPALAKSRRSSVTTEDSEIIITKPVRTRRTSAAAEDDTKKPIRARRNSAQEKDEESTVKPVKQRRGSTQDDTPELLQRNTRSRRSASRDLFDDTEEVKPIEKDTEIIDKRRSRRNSVEQLEDPKPVVKTPSRPKRRHSITENAVALEPIDEKEQEVENPIKIKTNLDLSIINESSFTEETEAKKARLSKDKEESNTSLHSEKVHSSPKSKLNKSKESNTSFKSEKVSTPSKLRLSKVKDEPIENEHEESKDVSDKVLTPTYSRLTKAKEELIKIESKERLSITIEDISIKNPTPSKTRLSKGKEPIDEYSEKVPTPSKSRLSKDKEELVVSIEDISKKTLISKQTQNKDLEKVPTPTKSSPEAVVLISKLKDEQMTSDLPARRSPRIMEKCKSGELHSHKKCNCEESPTDKVKSKKLNFEETTNEIKENAGIILKEAIVDIEKLEERKTHLSDGSDGSFKFHLSNSKLDSTGTETDLNDSKSSTHSDKENLAQNIEDLMVKKSPLADKIVTVLGVKELPQQKITVARASNVFRPKDIDYSFMEPMDIDTTIDTSKLNKSNFNKTVLQNGNSNDSFDETFTLSLNTTEIGTPEKEKLDTIAKKSELIGKISKEESSKLPQSPILTNEIPIEERTTQPNTPSESKTSDLEDSANEDDVFNPKDMSDDYEFDVPSEDEEASKVKDKPTNTDKRNDIELKVNTDVEEDNLKKTNSTAEESKEIVITNKITLTEEKNEDGDIDVKVEDSKATKNLKSTEEKNIDAEIEVKTKVTKNIEMPNEDEIIEVEGADSRHIEITDLTATEETNGDEQIDVEAEKTKEDTRKIEFPNPTATEEKNEDKQNDVEAEESKGTRNIEIPNPTTEDEDKEIDIEAIEPKEDTRNMEIPNSTSTEEKNIDKEIDIEAVEPKEDTRKIEIPNPIATEEKNEDKEIDVEVGEPKEDARKIEITNPIATVEKNEEKEIDVVHKKSKDPKIIEISNPTAAEEKKEDKEIIIEAEEPKKDARKIDLNEGKNEVPTKDDKEDLKENTTAGTPTKKTNPSKDKDEEIDVEICEEEIFDDNNTEIETKQTEKLPPQLSKAISKEVDKSMEKLEIISDTNKELNEMENSFMDIVENDECISINEKLGNTDKVTLDTDKSKDNLAENSQERAKEEIVNLEEISEDEVSEDTIKKPMKLEKSPRVDKPEINIVEESEVKATNKDNSGDAIKKSTKKSKKLEKSLQVDKPEINIAEESAVKETNKDNSEDTIKTSTKKSKKRKPKSNLESEEQNEKPAKKATETKNTLEEIIGREDANPPSNKKSRRKSKGINDTMSPKMANTDLESNTSKKENSFSLNKWFEEADVNPKSQKTKISNDQEKKQNTSKIVKEKSPRLSLEEFANQKLDEYLAKKLDEFETRDKEDLSDEESEVSNSFIDDMAEEGEEDTPSEDSNAIIDEGEAINSDSDRSYDDYDEDDDSFVCDEENVELLSGEEYDLGDTKKKSRILNVEDRNEDVIKIEKKTKPEGKKIRTRIIRVEDSSSDEEIINLDSSNAEDEVTKSRNRRSSISIIENINVKEIKDTVLSARINQLVDTFCTTIPQKGDISMNLSLEYGGSVSKKSKRKSLPDVETQTNSTVDLMEEPKNKKRKHSKDLSVSLSEDPTSSKKLVKRRLSKSLENIEDVGRKCKRKKSKKSQQKEETAMSSEDLRKETFGLMSQLLNDVKNRPRRVLKPSTTKLEDLNSTWLVEEEVQVKPSTTIVSDKEIEEFKKKKIHPKDFRNQMLYDPSRVKRIGTKQLLKKKGAYF